MVVCGLAIVACVVLSLTDTFFEDRNCGSALLPRDAATVITDTGDIAEDDFAYQRIVSGCAHEISARRFLCFVLLLGGIASGIGASRLRPPEPRFPGDPIV